MRWNVRTDYRLYRFATQINGLVLYDNGLRYKRVKTKILFNFPKNFVKRAKKIIH